MLREKIDKYISEATLEMKAANGNTELENKVKEKVGCLRLIKAEFLKYNASKEAVNKPMNDIIEISILNKMVKQRKEAAEIYTNGNRIDLAKKEISEAEFIESYLPDPVTENDIEAEIDNIINSGIEPIKKNMGTIIKQVKVKYPTADGKIVSQIVSKKLN